MITQLIDKQDNFEVVRDQVASILALESDSQQALATAAAKDPNLWKLRVYTERTNPWEMFLNEDGSGDNTPVVNVWFDNANYTASKSDTVQRQLSVTTLNVDVYGFGFARDDGAGHMPGDQDAASVMQRAVKLVRNILMSSEYTYLGLRGLVWKRWPQSITTFQPELNGRSMQQIHAARVAFVVEHNEFSPQYEPSTLDYVMIEIKRASDGRVISQADYDYLTP